MVVGIGKVELYIPTAQSLKDKRGVVKSLVQRIRNKFNVSVCELGKNDIWKNAVIGLAVISKDKEIIDQTYTALEKFFEEAGDFLVIRYEVEIL